MVSNLKQAIRVQICHRSGGTMMPEKRVASHYDQGNTDIVGDITGDSSMTYPLSDQYDIETSCVLVCGDS